MSYTALAKMTFGTDDTAAIQSAVNSASQAGGGVLTLPAGASMITSTITWASKVSMTGKGPFVTDLIWAAPGSMGNTTRPAMIWDGGAFNGLGPHSETNPTKDFTFSGFQIDMDAVQETGSLSYLASCVAFAWTVDWTV